MRIARRTALLVALSLLATLGLVATGHLSGGRAADAQAIGEAAFVVQADGLQAAVTRLDQRRDSSSQRGSKHPLLLLAVMAALLAITGGSVRRARASQRVRPPLTSWWFRSGGRAPPLFHLSVV